MGTLAHLLAVGLISCAAANLVPATAEYPQSPEVAKPPTKIEPISPGCKTCNWGPPLNANDKENAHELTVKRAHTSPANMSAAAWAMKNGLIDSDPEMKIQPQPKILNAKMSKRWPSGVVPYTIEDTFSTSHRAIIQAGIDDITAKTCVTFRAKEDTDADWMEIMSTGASGCSANAAYYGPGFGAHSVKLMLSGCVHISVVIHELLHILSVSHEQQRPDRDNYVEMHWMNMQVDKTSNMWKFASTSEDLSSMKICEVTGSDPQDFSDCVHPGTQVDDFGIPYDYESVMHYGLKSFAIDSSQNVMTPKNGYTGTISGDIMSAADITRLQRAYSCKESAPYTYSGCGGFRYSATGGDMDGTQDTGCEWILKTDAEKGITITFSSFNIPGDCSTEYLEVRGGTANDGPLIGKYCADNLPPSSLETKHNAIYAKYVKKASGSTASWAATWTTSAMTCCPKVQYEKSSLGGSYIMEAGKSYKGFPVYKQEDGNKYMVGCPGSNKWAIVDAGYDSYTTSCPPTYQKTNDGGAYCPHDAIGAWQLYNGNDYEDIADSKVRCSDCDLYPAEPECASCCSKVNLVGTHSDWVATGFYSGGFQGGWTATGNTVNGLAEYKSDNQPSYCLWFGTGGKWIINSCGAGGAGGFVFGSGGIKCPEQADSWSFFSQTGLGVIQDAGMKTTCAVSCSDDPPSTPTGASSDWDSSTKLGGTMVTYTCSTGDEVKAVCDAATQAWKPTSITCKDGGAPPPTGPTGTTAKPTATTAKPTGGTTKKPSKGKPSKGKPGKPSKGKPSKGKPSKGKPSQGKPSQGKPKPSKGKPKPSKGKPKPSKGKPKPSKKPSKPKPKPSKKPSKGKGKKGKKGIWGR